jgi:hypothetical protein
LTLIRVHVDERPRIESTSTSSTASSFATFGCFAFHRSNPSSAAFLSGELATTISGILVRFFFAGVFFAAPRARDGATRDPSPGIF